MPTSDSPTARLGLIVPVGSDPFHTSDFVNNWEAVEAHPGIAVVASLPGSGWVGQAVYNQADHQVHVWDGTVWRAPAPPLLWNFHASPSTNIGTSGSPYNSATVNFTVPYAITAWVVVEASIQIDDVANTHATATINAQFDGTTQVTVKWQNALASSNSGAEAIYGAMGQGVISLAAGTHAFKINAFHDVIPSGTDTVFFSSYNVNVLSVQKGAGSQ